MDTNQWLDDDIATGGEGNGPFNLAFGAKEKWMNAGWWAKFIAVIFLIFSGIMAITIVTASTAILFYMNSAMNLPLSGGFGLALLAAFIAIMIYWALELWKFGNKVRVGIKTDNMTVFDEGVKHLKRYFLIFLVFMSLSIFIQIISTLFLTPDMSDMPTQFGPTELPDMNGEPEEEMPTVDTIQ